MVKQRTVSALIKKFFHLFLLFPFFALAETAPEPIALGAIYSLSGWGAVGGVAELRATKLAVEEINTAGGILGRPIELHVEDNRSDLKETVSAFQKLHATEQIPVLLGPNWAEFAEVVAPIADRKRVVMLSSSGYTRTLTKGKPYVFTTLTPHHTHTKLLFDRIAQAGHKKIAILHSINTYYESIYQSFLERFKTKGIALHKTLAIEPKTTDFRSFLLRLKSDGVDGILALLQESGEIPAFLRQAQELELHAQIYAADISYDDVLHKDPSLAEGVEFFRYITTSTPAFQEKFLATYDAPALLGVGEAYDNVYLIKHCMETYGVTAKQVKECLQSVRYQGVSGTVTFDEEGLINSPREVTRLETVKDGKFVSIAGDTSHQ